MPKHFNTTGPVHPTEHYSIDPMSRLDWEEIHELIAAKKFLSSMHRAKRVKPAPYWR